MSLTGEMIIGNSRIKGVNRGFYGINPVSNERLQPCYKGAETSDVDRACHLAREAFFQFRQISSEDRATFLEQIAENIESIGSSLIERARLETGLPEARLSGESRRTVGQLKAFAKIVRSRLWQEPVFDSPDPELQPLPKPDLRTRYIPLGPVAIFGASNFPLAFSVADGDTASALAAGCPVVVKAHPAHPGTSELVGCAIQKAVKQCKLHPGVFSLLFCSDTSTGTELVNHHEIKAVGFTGSQAGGTALMSIAANRPEPIPVYAEMSSINPVFLLPEALKSSGKSIAEGFTASLVMGAGQFCTNPGVVIAIDGSELDRFIELSSALLAESSPQTMLTTGIFNAYQAGVRQLADNSRVSMHLYSSQSSAINQANPVLASVRATDFLASPELSEEVFGPVSIVVRCQDFNELVAVAKHLNGQLTATIHCLPSDYDLSHQLLSILELKAGRVLFNGYPTGVEVSHGMIHGGPYPASSNCRTTSVGSSAIRRFLRPVCYQNVPETLLPEALQNSGQSNGAKILDGVMTTD